MGWLLTFHFIVSCPERLAVTEVILLSGFTLHRAYGVAEKLYAVGHNLHFYKCAGFVVKVLTQVFRGAEVNGIGAYAFHRRLLSRGDGGQEHRQQKGDGNAQEGFHGNAGV